jgi:hypothetical protein
LISLPKIQTPSLRVRRGSTVKTVAGKWTKAVLERDELALIHSLINHARCIGLMILLPWMWDRDRGE